jgi:hypothetical protein
VRSLAFMGVGLAATCALWLAANSAFSAETVGTGRSLARAGIWVGLCLGALGFLGAVMLS